VRQYILTVGAKLHLFYVYRSHLVILIKLMVLVLGVRLENVVETPTVVLD
jgi:hypothetical protein